MSTDIRQMSEREIEILRLVAEGLSNQQIANHLGVSVNTVKVHLRNVFGKIGAASRTEATMYAVRAGLVDVHPADLGRSVEAPPDGSREPDALDEQEVAPAEPVVAAESFETLAPAGAIVPAPVAQPAAAVGAAPSAAARSNPRRYLAAGVAAVVLLLAIIVGLQLTGWPASAGTGAAALQGEPAQDRARWRPLADMRAPRAAFAVVPLNDLLYVIGGENESGILGSVERFDARFGTWTQLSQKPTPVTDIRAVVLGGKIYVPGGRRSGDPKEIVDVVERYDPQTERWDVIPSLPGPRSGYALAALEGKIFLFGGWDGERYRDEVFEYDPEGETWIERSPLPTARAFGDAAVVAGSIYVIGGQNESGPVASNEAYTPYQEGAQPWARRAPMPEPRGRLSTAVALSVIHVLGGDSPEMLPAKYNVRTDSWESFAAAPAPLGVQPGVALLDTEVIGLGGKLDAQRYSATMQAYQATFTISLPIQ